MNGQNTRHTGELLGAGGQCNADYAAKQAAAMAYGEQLRDRSPVEQAIDEIDSAIESLTYELNELGIRMSPVLRPQGNSAQNTPGSPDPKPGIVMPSPIEERLQTLSKRLRIIASATAITRNLLTI